MEIVHVWRNEHRRSIPVRGWELVRRLLHGYANGTIQSSRFAEQQTAKDLGDSRSENAGMAVGLFLLAGGINASNKNNLVDDLLKKAEEVLKRQDRYSRSYDYDAMGTAFFKSTIDIGVLCREENLFCVSISAAYVGDKPEDELAQKLGVPRVLQNCSVEIETKPLSGNRFVFDFNVIMTKLNPVFSGQQRLTSTGVLHALMNIDSDVSRISVLLAEVDGIEVRLHPSRVSRRYDWIKGQKQDLWSTEGSNLYGGLERDFKSDDSNVKATPTFVVFLSAPNPTDGYFHPPIWEPTMERNALELATKIERAFQ